MKELSYDILIKLVSEIASKEKEERAKLPYNANIIDNEGIRIDENAHSRILAKLLNYAGHDHSFPIYQTFLDLLKNKCYSVRNIIIHNPNIKPEKERIDILIDESPTYSIIIENKVCWAVDQPEQIERYIKKIQSHKVPNEGIFVVYLTWNGCKKVKDISLTEKAKNILNYDDNKLCRFIELNYKDDLLPMFELAATQIDRDKEPLLYSSLIQYADYWKGKFLMRDDEKKIPQKIAKYMANELNVNSVQDCLKISNEWDSFQNALDEKQNELMKQVLVEKVVKPLKKCLGNDYKYELSEYFNITPANWKHAYICLYRDSKKDLFIGVYGSEFTRITANALQNAGYEEDVVDKNERGYCKRVGETNMDTPDFWDLVDNGKVLRKIKGYIKEILTALEGKRL